MELKKTSKKLVKVYQEVIEKTDYSSQKLKGTYESVEFRSCTFTDISGINFTDCLFTSCNLGNATVGKSKMQDVKFLDCKLIGINFFQVQEFGFAIDFENCLLDFASFDHKKMNKSSFKNCRLHGANFSQADLSKATMENCDLLDAIFSYTILNGIDFTTNRNFTIDPQLNQIKKARFSSSSLAGLLSRFEIIIE
jgi:fluoroquinolone resistance protein